MTDKLTKTFLKAMKSQLVSKWRAKGLGRILKDSPFRRLPAVSKYEITVSPYNPLLLKWGIQLRLPKVVKYEVIKPTQRMNRYMKFMLIRIREEVLNGNYKKAWMIANLQLKHSCSFRMSAFNHIMRGWYYNTAISQVWKLNRKVNLIIKNELGDLNYRRVYIPKGNDKFRPLGVPKPEWRIALHLYNGLLQEVLGPSLLSDQHAYRPGMGTWTAWIRLLDLIVVSKNIYETDLKGFFDNISIYKIFKALKDKFLPDNLSDQLFAICQAVPKLPKEEKLDESKYKNFDHSVVSAPNLIIRNDLELDFFGDDIVIKGAEESNTPDYNDGVFEDPFNEGESAKSFPLVPGGVPQGMPASPFLSILALKEYLSQCKSINYADDQIFFPDEGQEIKDFPEFGIKHAQEKCRQVKKDGVWLADGIKFLGLRFRDGELISETRSGVKEPIRFELLNLFTAEGLSMLKEAETSQDLETIAKACATNSLLTEENKLSALQNIIDKGIFGFAQACMAIADWENNHSAEDMRKAKQTWARKLNKKSLTGRIPNNTDSSYSVPFLALVTASIVKDAKTGKTAQRLQKGWRSSNNLFMLQWLADNGWIKPSKVVEVGNCMIYTYSGPVGSVSKLVAKPIN